MKNDPDKDVKAIIAGLFGAMVAFGLAIVIAYTVNNTVVAAILIVAIVIFITKATFHEMKKLYGEEE